MNPILKEILLALVAGIAVGFIFRLVKLPVPAPPSIAGIIGILGIFIGYKAAQQLL